MVGAGFRLEAGLRLVYFFLFDLKCRTMRVPNLFVGWEVGCGMFPMAFVMVGFRDAMITARGDILSGRLTQSGAKMSRQRGAMERSIASGPEIFIFRRRQFSGLFDESSVLRYLSA